MTYLLAIISVLIAAILFRRYVVGVFRVNQDSMLPALKNGDFVLTNNWTPLCLRLNGEVPVKIGNIVIAKINGKHVIKRVASTSVTGVFLKGDNQSVSLDSRIFGEVPYENIVGVVFKVIKSD